MMFLPFTEEERGKFLGARRDALRAYNERVDASAKLAARSEGESGLIAEAERHLRVAERAESQYFARLPRLTMSLCPFDGKPLIRSFDPYGLDGLWWRSDASPPEAPSCPHFCVLLGAVNFAKRKPHAGDWEVYPGPQVPYVIPRLLDLPEMIAVVSGIEMANRYVAYPVSYFAERRPPSQELAAGWARTNYVYRTQLGEDGWRISNDTWDFDLRRWLEAGKLRWCPPGTGNSQLSTEQPDKCPYLDLRGERQRMVVRGGEAQAAGLPDGEIMWALKS